MLEETDIVYNDPVSVSCCKLEFFERLIRFWFLAQKQPYPYKKWLFHEARTYAELKNASECLWKGGGRVDSISMPEIKKCYVRVNELLTSMNHFQYGSEFQLDEKSYYGYLDW